MGSGKSTLGKQLAMALGRIFTDLDRFIEVEENRTITDIFNKEGEAFFRKLETNALSRTLSYPNQVIAIGGGTPCFPQNLKLIQEKAISIYLKISESELLKRIAHSATQRPLLQGKSETEMQSFINDLLKGREGYYNQADILMESDSIDIQMIVSRLDLWEK